MNSVVSKSNPINYYKWGNNAEAWTLLENDNLSIKQESMPAGTEEELHYHKHLQQFFYVTKGRAVFEIDKVIFIVTEGEGIHIEPNQPHRIMNKDEEPLEFIICSQPSTQTTGSPGPKGRRERKSGPDNFCFTYHCYQHEKKLCKLFILAP